MQGNLVSGLKETARLPWPFFAGILLICTLPLLSAFPYFMPPAWGQVVFFRIIAACLLFAAFAFVLLKHNWVAFRLSPQAKLPVLALAAWLGVLLLATFFSLEPHFSFWGTPWRAWGVLTYVFYGLFALLLFFTLEKKGWSMFWMFFLSVGAASALIGILQTLGGFSSFLVAQSARPTSTFGNSSFFAIFLSTLLPILYFRFSQAAAKQKLLFGAFLALFLLAIFLTEARAAYIGVFIGAIFFFLFHPSFSKKAKRAGIAVLAAGALLVLLVNLTSPPSFAKKYEPLWNRLSVTAIIQQEPRFAAWGYALQGIADRPVLGYGPYNSSIAFDRYFQSTDTRFLGRSTGWWDTFHNLYLDIAVGTGLLGLAAFLLFLGALWLALAKAKKTQAHRRLPIHAVQTAFLAYLVAMLFSFNSFALYLLFFAIVAYALFLTTPSPKSA